MATYDPNKNYEWKPEDRFILKGEQFSIVLNTLRELAIRPGGTNAIALVNAYQVVEGLLADGVAAGFVVEQVPAVEAIPLP